MQIAVIGAGAFGSGLATIFGRAGHSVSLSDTEAGAQRLRAAIARSGASAAPTLAAVRGADVVTLAVPFSSIDEVLQRDVANALEGKTVIDVTNPLGPDRLSLTIGQSTSGAEQIAGRLPRSRVVKAFSTLLAATLPTPVLGGARLVVPVAGDDATAKGVVLELAAQTGFDAVDAGPLSTSRYLEPAIVLLLGLSRSLGTGIGLSLARS